MRFAVREIAHRVSRSGTVELIHMIKRVRKSSSSCDDSRNDDSLSPP